jgi:hypothetical protein
MAYMNADTGPKVGFRPYGQTDAFGASHFMCVPDEGQADPSVGDAGLGVYYLNRPFDPWELYDDVHHTDGVRHLGDLGQNHPFKPTAWKLHGLGQGSDPTAAAADELLSSGHITQAEHDAILEGSMGFADVLGYDPTDQSSWNALTNLFQEVNADLKNLEAAYIADAPAPGSPANPTYAALGQQLIQQRQQYTDFASQFVRYYTLVIGTPPAGLSGLGIVWIYWAAGAAVFIVGAFITLYAIRTWAQGIDVSKIAAQTASGQQQTTAVNTAALLKQLADAQAKGDTVTAQAILKTLAAIGASPQPPSTLETWLMTNAKWLGIGAAALIAIGPISQGLFGRGRR